MSDEPEKIKTFDADRGVGVASGLPPHKKPLGPPRAPAPFYAGEMILKKKRVAGATDGTYRLAGEAQQRKDVERHPNGAVVGERNKIMRRAQRGKLKKRASKVERGIENARALKRQALEVAKDEGHGAKYADRLLKKELAIHTPAYVPSKAELRAQRTERRRRERRGEVKQDAIDIVPDAISQLVDNQNKKRGEP